MTLRDLKDIEMAPAVTSFLVPQITPITAAKAYTLVSLNGCLLGSERGFFPIRVLSHLLINPSTWK